MGDPTPIESPLAQVLREGGDRVLVQNLFGDASKISTRAGGVCEISFLTGLVTPKEVSLGTSEYVGLVVWVPRADLQRMADREGHSAGDEPEK